LKCFLTEFFVPVNVNFLENADSIECSADFWTFATSWSAHVEGFLADQSLHCGTDKIPQNEVSNIFVAL
jgi:hypothetical protein